MFSISARRLASMWYVVFYEASKSDQSSETLIHKEQSEETVSWDDVLAPCDFPNQQCFSLPKMHHLIHLCLLSPSASHVSHLALEICTILQYRSAGNPLIRRERVLFLFDPTKQ